MVVYDDAPPQSAPLPLRLVIKFEKPVDTVLTTTGPVRQQQNDGEHEPPTE